VRSPYYVFPGLTRDLRKIKVSSQSMGVPGLAREQDLKLLRREGDYRDALPAAASISLVRIFEGEL